MRELGLENDEGRCRAETGIRLYSNFGTQPLTAAIFSSKCPPIPFAYLSGEIDAVVNFITQTYRNAFSQVEDILWSEAISATRRH
jgi:hypothetical protein